MRDLIEIRADLHKTLEKFYSLKTKAARVKLRDGKLRDLRRESGEALEALFKPGDLITLDHSVNCSAPSGGGWGCRGTVEILSTENSSITVASGNQILYIELTEDWKRWGSDSFWAFASALLKRGQDVRIPATKHSLALSRKHLKGALSVRNKLTFDGIPFRSSESYQNRLLVMFNEIRGYQNFLSQAV